MAKNPAAILYDENGVRVGVEDNALRISVDPAKVVVHGDDTITSDDSIVLTGYGQTELLLFLNIKATPTGTDPTLQYTVQEVDPGDEETVIGAAIDSEVFTDTGTQTISFITLNGGAVKVSWAVTGTDTPSFTGVYATVLAKAGGTAKMLGVGVGASYPDPAGNYPEPVDGEKVAVSIDSFGNLMTRGPVLTDEDSYFDDFIDATADPSWVFSEDGGSHYIVQSILSMTAGKDSGKYSKVRRAGDYGPMTLTAIARIDYRQTFQTCYVGFSNDSQSPPAVKRASIRFSDDNARICQFVTQASATQIETTDVAIPGGGQSAEWHRYTVEIGAGYASFNIDGVQMCVHKTHIPGPYDVLDYGAVVENSQAVSLATTLWIDSFSFKNHNAVEIAGHFTGDPLRVELNKDAAVAISGQHGNIVVEHESRHTDLDGHHDQGRELLAVADPEMRSTLDDILDEMRKLNMALSELSGFKVDKGDL